jgi:hypothetical protein
MKVYEVWRYECQDFDTVKVQYGFFSTREKAETEIRLLDQQVKSGQLFCLDFGAPDPFKIREVELDEGLQSYLKEEVNT